MASVQGPNAPWNETVRKLDADEVCGEQRRRKEESRGGRGGGGYGEEASRSSSQAMSMRVK